MTDLPVVRPALRPDARLVQLHAERGDPHARLSGALADLEGADWGMLLSGEDALARQLAALLGGGTLRVDPRVRVSREALANAGLAAASLDADWRGARAVWLLEPDTATLERAARAGVRVIVDTTLAPGGLWIAAGAEWLVYRDSVTLCGHADAPLSALFGAGAVPRAVGAPPSDLSVALALRDVATLPLRLARAARTTAQLAERLGGAAQPAGPTALLLAPDAAADTAQALGGVRAAARSVPGGVLLTPGLEEAETVLALLRGAQSAPAPDWEDVGPQEPQPETASRVPSRRDAPRQAPERTDSRRTDAQHQDEPRRNVPRRDFRVARRDGRNRPERAGRPEAPELPERFVFEAPEVHHPGAPEAHGTGAVYPESEYVESAPVFPTPEAAYPALRPEDVNGRETAPTGTAPQTAPEPEEAEQWEPEIVFSERDTLVPVPEVAPALSAAGSDEERVEEEPEWTVDTASAEQALLAEASLRVDVPPAGMEPGAEGGRSAAPFPEALAPEQSLPEQPSPQLSNSEPLSPDLPGGKTDPAADLTDEQAAVYARLRDWRNAEAKRQELSKFIVASNATLAEIARRVPFTLEDLRAVKGMGPGRIGKYGEKILEVVRG